MSNIFKKLVGAIFITTVAQLSSAADGGSSYAGYGALVENVAAGRKIIVEQNTRWINVKNDEIVTFVVGEQSFTYQVKANTNTQSFSFGEIAPTGISVPQILVYVSQASES